jgi:hypothetical protein
MLIKVKKSDYKNTRIDPLVTAKAMTFFQTDDRFLAVRDVPLITQPVPAGIMSVLDTDDLNRDEVRKRSSEAEAEKAGFKFKDVNFKTDERSLEYDLNAAKAAGASPGRNPADVIPFALAYKGNLHTEVRFSTLWKNDATWSRVVTGAGADGADGGAAMNRVYWDDATKDPIAAIKKEIDIFLLRTGMLPTKIRFGRQLFTAISTHPMVRAQVAVISSGGGSATSSFTPAATADQLAALIGCAVSVGSAIQNLAGEGLVANNAFIVPSKSALMTYDAPSKIITPDTPTGFARVAFDGLAPQGFQVRSFDRPEIGAGGSRASVLDLYQGFVIIDNKMGTYFHVMAQ